MIGPGKSRHCQTWHERHSSWNESRILAKSSQFLSSEQPCEQKKLGRYLEYCGSWKNTIGKLSVLSVNVEAIWFEFWMNGALVVTVEIFVFCGWWFSNSQFDIMSGTHLSCDTAGRELWLAILSSLLCPEADRKVSLCVYFIWRKTNEPEKVLPTITLLHYKVTDWQSTTLTGTLLSALPAVPTIFKDRLCKPPRVTLTYRTNASSQMSTTAGDLQTASPRWKRRQTDKRTSKALITWDRYELRPVRLQIGLHTNASYCLHEAGLKNLLMPVSLIPVAEPTRMTRTGLKSDHGTM